MTTIELYRDLHQRRPRYDFLGTLRAGLDAMVLHRQERRRAVALSRLSPRILRDMGFDPEQIYEAPDGTWDEVDPASQHRFLPRTERI